MKPFDYITDKDIEDYKSYILRYPPRRGITLQAHISDIHFGVMDAKTEYDILKNQFILPIMDLPLDIISIDGDLFNKLDMCNSDAVLYATLFVNDIVSICKNNKTRGIDTTFMIIMGTKSHDADQLRLFYHYLDDPDIDIRIVEQIQFEIVKGVRILCIPELYGTKEEVYRHFLWESGEYDMCFMHGTIEGSVYGNNAGESRVFRPQDFGNCNGPVIAGHVHPGGCFHSFMYYNGSPIRWSFGEEGPKGFQLVLYDLDTRYHYVHLEQIHSFRYDTITVDQLFDLTNDDPKKIIEYVNTLKNNGIDYIRLKCRSTPNTVDAIGILQEYYRTDKRIKFKIEKPDVNKDTFTEEANAIYDKYNYIFNKSMSPYDILARFINDNETDVLITADDILALIRE